MREASFFLEGKSILSFAYDDVNLFYTRRIGHLSDYTPQAAGNGVCPDAGTNHDNRCGQAQRKERRWAFGRDIAEFHI